MDRIKRRSCRGAARLWKAATLLCFFCCLGSLQAQGVSSKPSVLFIGRLNQDQYADTVMGRAFGGASTRLPEMVVWGKDPVHPMPPNGPPMTMFKYPVYPRFAGSVSFLQLNPGDSLTDMLFFLWGRNDSTGVEPDTGRAVAIFGQAALSTLPFIDFSQIQTGFQTVPFLAQDVQHNIHLTEPQVRDLSDVESYLLAPFNVNVQGAPPPIVTQVNDSIEVRIYPNPSIYTATIEAALPAGSYTAKVVGVSGQVFEEQTISLQSNETLWRSIDVSRLVSGYYVVQLLREGASVGSYPFLIKR